MPHAMLAFKRSARRAALSRPRQLTEPFLVLGMHPREPLVGALPNFGVRVPEHGLPTGGVVDPPGQEVPIPQTNVGAKRRQGITFLALAQSASSGFARQLDLNARQGDWEIHGLGDVIVGAQAKCFDDVIAVR